MIDIDANLDQLNTHRALALSVHDSREAPDASLRYAIENAETIEVIAGLVTGRKVKRSRRRAAPAEAEGQLEFDFEDADDLTHSPPTVSNSGVRAAEVGARVDLPADTYADGNAERGLVDILKSHNLVAPTEAFQPFLAPVGIPIHDDRFVFMHREHREFRRGRQRLGEPPGLGDHPTAPFNFGSGSLTLGIEEIIAKTSEIQIKRGALDDSWLRMPQGP